MKRFFLFFIVFAFMCGGVYYTLKSYDADRVSALNLSGLLNDQEANAATISSVILPHIDTAKTERQKLLAEVKSKTTPERIIIVSTNHQNSGEGDILIYPNNWQVKGGELKNDREVFDNITSAGLAEENAGAFFDEHGIKNVIDDIYAVYPKAVYSSIILRDTVQKAKIDELAKFFAEGDSKAMIIASVDFSHYNPRALANIHDNYTIAALESRDMEKIWQAETDSPQSLLLATKFAEETKRKNFHLFSRGNSADASESDDTETTSWVNGYYCEDGEERITEKSSSFVIAGDAMFDRNVWHNYKDSGLDKIFSNLGNRVFRGVDLSMLNLEGPISETEINDDYASGSMIFNFPPVVPQVLKNLGINTVSLANNHTLNAKDSGFKNTQNVLGEAGINYFGRQNGFDPNTDILRLESEIPMSVIGIDTLAKYNEETLLKSIKSEKAKGRFVIMFPHWGTEYKESHDSGQKTLAAKWITAGADMIVGSHPHVVEDFEVIDKVPVIYSMGNFVFDQFFSEETQRGLILAGTITNKKITLTFLPTKEVLVKPQFLKGSEKNSAIAKIFDIESAEGFVKISDDTIEIGR